MIFFDTPQLQRTRAAEVNFAWSLRKPFPTLSFDPIEVVDLFVYLGVTLDPKLKSHDHCSVVIKKI